jgi:hypothetical protein
MYARGCNQTERHLSKMLGMGRAWAMPIAQDVMERERRRHAARADIRNMLSLAIASQPADKTAELRRLLGIDNA